MSSINGQNIERMRVNGNEIALAKINGKVVFQKKKLIKTFFGDSMQKTTTGKNLFDYSYYYDNYINNGSQYYIYPCILTLKPNTNYTVSTNTIEDEWHAIVFIRSGSNTDTSITSDDNGVFPNSPRTIATDSNGNCVIYIKLENLNNENFQNGIFWVQIEKGSVATEYEPYTGGKPSPNPDYPQKISSINGVNLKISNGSKELKIPINLQGNILAKVGDYADELQVYSNGDVKLIKKIREYKMTGNENVSNMHTGNLFDYQLFFNNKPYIVGYGLSNYYKYNPVQSGINPATVHGEFVLQHWSDGIDNNYNLLIKDTNHDNITNFKNHLAELYNAETPVKIYYPLVNSTTTKVDNIKSELNSFGDYSNIEIETTYS